jgi:uncharacterized iron-regulated protein
MRNWGVASLISVSMILGAGALQSAERPITVPTLPDFTSFMMARVDGTGSTAVTVDQAADALKDYDVVFVGEFHDHIANHLAELALLRTIHARAPKLALSMEQFERDRQERVDDYLAGKIGEETLTSGLGWKNYAEAYRPLVEYAKDNHLLVIAANAPQSIVRCIAKEGAGFLSTLSADKRSLIAAELHAGDGPYKQKFLHFAGDDAAHGGSSNGKADEKARQRIENNFAAQIARDDTMAESIASFLRANPGYRVLHVTGAFHVEEKLGTIERLRLRAPQLKVALVMPVQLARDTAAMKPEDARQAEFAILLRREPEPYVTDTERKAVEAREGERFREAADGRCKG